MGGTWSVYGGEERVGKPRVRDHFRDPGIGGEENIKLDLQEVGCGVMD
jgi:hypothetical protein